MPPVSKSLTTDILALQDAIDDVRKNVEAHTLHGIVGPEHTTKNHIIPVLTARDRFTTSKLLIKYQHQFDVGRVIAFRLPLPQSASLKNER